MWGPRRTIMDEAIAQIQAWHDRGRGTAVATVVSTSGSTPRQPGAKLIVSQDRELAGSVSGGCVEADVALHALEVMQERRPRLVQYGISDEMGITVGLACGGSIDVLIEPPPLTPYIEVADLVRHEVPVVVATVLRPDPMLGRRVLVVDGQLDGSLGAPGLDAAVREQGASLLRQGVSKSVSIRDEAGRDVDVFLDVYPPPPTLLIFGGVHVGIPLTRFAKILGFRVRVIDPRGVFATRERFAEADELVIEQPAEYVARVPFNENSYVVVLAHDPKLDEPVLRRVLETPASYIGAIGSRKTNVERMARLRAQGMSDEKLGRVRAPIGLDIGARTPEEIAIAIMAEVVAARYGRAGTPLRELSGAFVSAQ
ncbi:MAG: XshC-Cox1 family protein [Chloroflexi bacterium]|nr:XshC-Cox1 family protein [Chloroflexota bacterium]